MNGFYLKFEAIINGVPKQDEIFIMGDFNARIGSEIIPGVKNRFNEDFKNEGGEQLIILCLQNQLHINSTFYDHKQQHLNKI